jgi:hypothetical protein
MWYKKNLETGEWYSGSRVYFPNGTVIETENDEPIDGWFWSKKKPLEMEEWEQQQQLNRTKNALKEYEI